MASGEQRGEEQNFAVRQNEKRGYAFCLLPLLRNPALAGMSRWSPHVPLVLEVHGIGEKGWREE